MPVAREYSVLEIDGPRLVAISASVSGSRIDVRRWLTATRPDSITADNARAVGEWIGSEFDRAGIGKARVVLAVSRGDVVLKQLGIPAGDGEVNDSDLAGIVRLQMLRQLTMQVDGAVIDFLPVGQGPPPGAEHDGSASLRWVMAGAIPADRAAWSREVVSGAGLSLRRIGLRCFGAATLLGDLSQRRAGPILGVAIGGASTEFVVVEEGVMTFARAVDTPRPESRSEIDPFADRMGVEAKRTWMSYRSARPGAEVEAVAVIGTGDLPRAVGERCAAAVGCSWESVSLPSIIGVPDTMPESERALAAPLAGLLAETILDRPTLDFANPRKMPDPSARRRQAVLAGVLGLILLGGTGYIVADQRLSRLRAELAEARAQEQSKRVELDKYLVSHARLNHFEQWSGAKVDWLAHLKRLSDEMPDAKLGQLDQVIGRASAAPQFSLSSGARYPAGTWSTRRNVTFDLSGRVESRQIASELRERLRDTGVFANVETIGPELPDRFTLQLVTGLAAPGAAKPAEASPRPASPGNDASNGKSTP